MKPEIFFQESCMGYFLALAFGPQLSPSSAQCFQVASAALGFSNTFRVSATLFGFLNLRTRQQLTANKPFNR